MTTYEAGRTVESSHNTISPLQAAGRRSVDLVGPVMPFGRNAEIFGENEPANYFYKLVSGAVRTYRVFGDGRRQIGGFYGPGDVFGLEIGDSHACSAEAIVGSKIMTIKRRPLFALAAHSTDVALQLWMMTADELRRAQGHAMLLVKTAQERVAGFLLEMAARSSSNETIELPMSRQDIADYLGLTIETVSRTFAQLESAATIAVPASRRIVLRDRAALLRLSA
jgi:CRP/FNR family nitrogen fixation transcriptional regulator